ncbi:Serine acetyltransferase [Brevundimonas sp. SH203]|uniref:serine O-acetyltransferase n=1 Tax=Brevundimonas sp. SH203 TaxID=345167 RepID=UPI0009C478D9|nr:serine O-acetyltransferase [Brevundimonas sp. SH203]GAW40872.1 Serine acetyltransferase [Brevundimonas sp. SH203]
MAKLEVVAETQVDSVWRQLRASAEAASREEPQLGSQMNAVILSHDDLAGALSFQIARKLADGEMSAMSVREVCLSAFKADAAMVEAAEADLQAVAERDPAIRNLLQPFLYFKGFQALQAWRVAHWLWGQGRETLAFHFQSRISELFQLDIHPAARLGKGLFLDHGTGIVIGETAVVADDVSMLHNVTLGGTGAERGDRHPKIGKGVLLGAGAKVLGNIHVGDYAKVASGSVVLKAVPSGCTVAGVPARLVNCPTGAEPARTMDHTLADVVYDFVI